jgi:putative membrane protein
MNFKLVTALIVAGLLVVFTAQNYQVVELRFLIWRLEMSRAILIFGVFAAGILSGWLVSSVSSRRHRPSAPAQHRISSGGV